MSAAPTVRTDSIVAWSTCCVLRATGQPCAEASKYLIRWTEDVEHPIGASALCASHAAQARSKWSKVIVSVETYEPVA